MQDMHRVSTSLDQWQEELSEVWNSQGLEGANHGTDCYFCVINLTGINRKNRSSLKYPDLQSARRPVAHCDEIIVPGFGELPDISDDDSSGVEENEEEMILDEDAPHPFSQMKRRTCCTVRILHSFCTSLECHSTNQKSGDCSLTAASDR